jgi:hypothetical protein
MDLKLKVLIPKIHVALEILPFLAPSYWPIDIDPSLLSI